MTLLHRIENHTFNLKMTLVHRIENPLGVFVLFHFMFFYVCCVFFCFVCVLFVVFFLNMLFGFCLLLFMLLFVFVFVCLGFCLKPNKSFFLLGGVYLFVALLKKYYLCFPFIFLKQKFCFVLFCV